jgi:glycosyltransferase involved in cell wall biosynthesis
MKLSYFNPMKMNRDDYKTHTIQYVFVIASYNNETNVYKNISSIVLQKYTNWRIIYINDASTDKTAQKLNELIQQYNISQKVRYIENETNMKQAYSKYKAYQMVGDNEVVCILDGDDWLKHDRVLNVLNQYYENEKYHIVTSNFDIYENNKTYQTGRSIKYFDNVLSEKQCRYANYSFGHLKTGLGVYFKSIPENRFKYNNKWLDRCTDVAEMVCVSELCKKQKLIQIDDVLYVYNKTNSVKYENSFYSSDTAQHELINTYIMNQPKCHYVLPQSYIIHIKGETQLHKNIYCQMDFIQPYKWDIYYASTPDKIQALLEKKQIHRETNELSHVNKQHMKLFNIQKEHCTDKALALIWTNLSLFHHIEKNAADVDHVVVFEDDIYSSKHFQEQCYINDHILKNKDVVYLGCHNEEQTIYGRTASEKFVPIGKDDFLYYGTYAVILSKKARNYIVSLGFDYFVEKNVSYDMFLNYIRLIELNCDLTFYKYQYQLFIPEVRKNGIQQQRYNDFYSKQHIDLRNYFITVPIH